MLTLCRVLVTVDRLHNSLLVTRGVTACGGSGFASAHLSGVAVQPLKLCLHVDLSSAQMWRRIYVEVILTVDVCRIACWSFGIVRFSKIAGVSVLWLVVGLRQPCLMCSNVQVTATV